MPQYLVELEGSITCDTRFLIDARNEHEAKRIAEERLVRKLNSPNVLKYLAKIDSFAYAEAQFVERLYATFKPRVAEDGLWGHHE